MKFTVENWDSDYGSPSSPDMGDGSENVDVSVELKPDRWEPILPDSTAAEDVLFIDGVRRVDASLWIDQPEGRPALGLAATYAAGAVRSNGHAEVVAASIDRG